jgi:hypothetical protein
VGDIKVDPPSKIFAKLVNKNEIKPEKGVLSHKKFHNPCLPSPPPPCPVGGRQLYLEKIRVLKAVFFKSFGTCHEKQPGSFSVGHESR